MMATAVDETEALSANANFGEWLSACKTITPQLL